MLWKDFPSIAARLAVGALFFPWKAVEDQTGKYKSVRFFFCLCQELRCQRCHISTFGTLFECWDSFLVFCGVCVMRSTVECPTLRQVSHFVWLADKNISTDFCRLVIYTCLLSIFPCLFFLEIMIQIFCLTFFNPLPFGVDYFLETWLYLDYHYYYCWGDHSPHKIV